MVQLHILSGKKAGTTWVARRFPYQAGRSPKDDLHLEEDGVWERHLRIEMRRGEGAVLDCPPEALVAVNGQPVRSVVLRNGDLIEAGSVKLRFTLSPTTQASLRWRETLTWVALGALCLGQVALIYWLTS